MIFHDIFVPLLVFWVWDACEGPDDIAELRSDDTEVVVAGVEVVAIPPPCTTIGDAVSVWTAVLPPTTTAHRAMLLSMAHDSTTLNDTAGSLYERTASVGPSTKMAWDFNPYDQRSVDRLSLIRRTSADEGWSLKSSGGLSRDQLPCSPPIKTYSKFTRA
jgi:hypothetical protein